MTLIQRRLYIDLCKEAVEYIIDVMHGEIWETNGILALEKYLNDIAATILGKPQGMITQAHICQLQKIKMAAYPGLDNPYCLGHLLHIIYYIIVNILSKIKGDPPSVEQNHKVVPLIGRDAQRQQYMTYALQNMADASQLNGCEQLSTSETLCPDALVSYTPFHITYIPV
jgi:hypothetical protein